MIPLSVPEIRGNEWKYVKECLDTNWVSSAGSFVDRFEDMMAEYIGTEFAVATVNGTAALHIALLLAGVEPDDEVLVSTLTFIAPANAIRYVGAWPVFVDAEPDYGQMDTDLLQNFIKGECKWERGELRNSATGRRVKAILPVHILGHPVDMDPLLSLAREYGLVVVEDATESLGARYKGRSVGQLGDIACFSFNGNKLITTGGGGMLATDNESLALRARYLTTQARDDSVEYIHGDIGYNYRLCNILAALGCAQLESVEEFVNTKHRVAAAYDKQLDSVPGIHAMGEAPWAASAFWMFTVFVDPDHFGMSSRDLLRYLASQDIEARPLWQPMHLSPAHLTSQSLQHGVAERLNREALNLPSSVGLAEEDQARVVSAIRQAANS